MSIPTITPEELKSRFDTGKSVMLIDVRTPVEFRQAHVAFARNVPLSELDPKAIGESVKGGDATLFFLCQAGTRGRQACEKLVQAGYPNVANVEGGTTACERDGLPMTHGKAAMSLERQVRIAAGSLVLLGVILGWAVHPAFIGLSAFVGAGLVYAGVSDTCGMGMLLARMPWNKCQSGAACTMTGDPRAANAHPSHG